MCVIGLRMFLVRLTMAFLVFAPVGATSSELQDEAAFYRWGKNMKLWLLRSIDGLQHNDNPWEPWFDKVFGFVVRAENEKDARKFAHEEAGAENEGEFLGEKIANTTSPWLDAKYSTCIELLPDGDAGIVLRHSRDA